MNSDRKYNGDVNSGALGIVIINLYINAESRRIETLSRKAIDEGIELIDDIRKERRRQRYLAHAMALPVGKANQ